MHTHMIKLGETEGTKKKTINTEFYKQQIKK